MDLLTPQPSISFPMGFAIKLGRKENIAAFSGVAYPLLG